MRGGDQHLPGRILGAWPKRTWLRRLQRLGQARLVRLWPHVEAKSPATRRRWQWTWVGDDRVFKKAGQQLGLVGTWDSGQEHRVRLGIEGLLWLVVIGEGKLVVPVDFAVRRPDPRGPGGPCRDKLTWLQVSLDRTWRARRRRCRQLPPPLGVAASWFGDSGFMAPVAIVQQGTLLIAGKRTSVVVLSDGRRVQGQDLLDRADWPWRDSVQVPGGRYARLTVSSPSDGLVTVVLVDAPGRDRYYLLCRATTITAPRLIQAWKRRSWLAHQFRTLQHLLATAVCQVATEGAYFGQLVLRLRAGLGLLYTARILLKGRVTMAEMLFTVNHHWRFLNSALLELQGLSWSLRAQAA